MNKPVKKIITIILCIAVLISIILCIQSYFQIQEGFQSTSCTMPSIGGVDTYLCDDESAAYQQLVDNTAGGVKTPICYSDPYSLHFTTTSSIAYVCYDINGEPVFNDVTGTYSDFDPLTDEDLLPQYGQEDSIMNYTAFGAGYNSFSISHTNTSKLAKSVSTIGVSHITYVKTQLSTIFSNKCGSGRDDKYTNTCNSISDALTTINQILTDTSSTSITHISTTLGRSLSTIKHATYNEFSSGFNDTYVMNPTQISTFIGYTT